jgi:hypothetical protein
MRRNSPSLLERLGLERRQRTDPGDLALAVLAGMGIGLVSCYLVDPQRGRERRARLRDKTLHSFRRAAESSRATGRDLRQRARGYAARARGLLHADEVEDDVRVERIRSDMGRLVSHPHALEVDAEDGSVTLSGAILSTEVQRFVRHVKRFPGVREVNNQLDVHTASEDVPELQGGGMPVPRRRNLLRESWPPAARLVAGVAGLGAWVAGSAGRPLGRTALCTVGSLAVWRALANEPVHGGRMRRRSAREDHEPERASVEALSAS